MTSPATRSFEYQGRRFVTYERVERFSGQRVARVPPPTIERAASHPITAALLPCCAGYFPRAHGHEIVRPDGDWSYVLLLCLKGSGEVRADGFRSALTAGRIAVLPPRAYHAYQADRRDPWSLYWVHFHGGLAGEYYNELTRAGTQPSRGIELDAHVIQSFEQLIESCAAPFEGGRTTRASACLHQLFGALMKARVDEAGAGPDADTRIRRAIDAVRSHLDLRVNMDELAVAAHVSLTHFSARFREITGDSPQKYFNKLRMQEACRLLRASDDKIEHISREVGFPDPFYFSKAFRKCIGLSPSEYRLAAAGAAAPAPVAR